MEGQNGAEFRDIWFFDTTKGNFRYSDEPTFGRVKHLLYEVIHRSLSQHDVLECYRLLRIVPRETGLDPYILFRFIMILVETNSTAKISTSVLLYLETLLSKLDVTKPEIFVEFLSYFIRHNRLDDARELYSQRRRYMSFAKLKMSPYVQENIRCYEFLLHYLSWKDKISQLDSKYSQFDLSIQGWIVNLLDQLRRPNLGNYEYFFICIVQILLHYGYWKKAYLIVSEYQRNNPNNITAHLLYLFVTYRLNSPDTSMKTETDREEIQELAELTDEIREQNLEIELITLNNFTTNIQEEFLDRNKFPINKEEKTIMVHLRKLDVSNPELVKLGLRHNSLVDNFKDMMNAMEVVSEIPKMQRWYSLKKTIDLINRCDNEDIINDCRIVWQTQYKRYWQFVDFVGLASDTDALSEEDRKLIVAVLESLKVSFGRAPNLKT